MTENTPNRELHRLFGAEWPIVLDDLGANPRARLVYAVDVEVLGLSYRKGECCLYVNEGGERKTIPLTDIEDIELAVDR